MRVAPIDVRGKRASTDEARVPSDKARTSAAKRAVDDPAFVTTIRVDDTAGETTNLAQVLARSLGVNVRQLGGLGGFSSISVRGAASGHTTVLVDGVPLSRIATVTTDLNRFELRTFSTLELYRGGVPPELGGAALGGALNLITGVGRPKDGKRFNVSMGGGSFGARHVRVRARDDVGAGGYHVSMGYSGANGDFTYFTDNGTNLNPDDDAFVERTNNNFERFDFVARYRYERGDTSVETGARGLFKAQGVPGSQSVQTRNTALQTISQLVDVKLTERRPFGRSDSLGALNAYVFLESQRYLDPDGEVGLAMQDRTLLTVSGGLTARFSGAFGDSHVVSAGVTGGFELFDQRDALIDRQSDGHRLRLGVTIADDLFFMNGRWLIQPAARLDVMKTAAPAALDGPSLSPPTSRVDVYPSPRLSTRFRLSSSAAIKANAGWYFRAPTVMELFGDRGFIVGNPELIAETGVSGDFGLVFAAPERHGELDRLYVETAVFASRPRNTIVLTPTAGLAVVPQNLGDAIIYGAELAGSMRWRRTLALTASYTFIDSKQRHQLASYDGKRLPQRPRHKLYGRVELTFRFAGRRVSVWSDVVFASGNYLDAANLTEVPRRTLVGAGLKLVPVPWLLIGIEAKNLADRRVETIPLVPPPRPDLTETPRPIADFFGYPLPGRAFYATAEVRY